MRPGITFDENTHTYRNDKGEVYLSGTSFINLFKNKFDTDFWSKFKAYQKYLEVPATDVQENFVINAYQEVGWKPKLPITQWKYLTTYLNYYEAYSDIKDKVLEMAHSLHPVAQEDIDKVLADWDVKSRYALVKGTNEHLKRETQDRVSNNEFNDWEFFDLGSLTPGIKPELRLYNHGYKIAGTADRVTIKADKTFDIVDYKTSKRIDTDSFFNPWTRTKPMMKAPINDLPDCNYIHYTLQMSLYAYMLEQYGFKCDWLAIYHIKDIVGEETPIRVKYLKKAIQLMLEHYAL